MESKKEIVIEWRRQHPKGRRRDLYQSDLGISKATVDRWWNESEVKERPLSAYETVQAWKLAHPDGTHAACVQETGLSRRTVYYQWHEKQPVAVIGQEEEISADDNRDVTDTETLKIIEEDNGQLAFDF